MQIRILFFGDFVESVESYDLIEFWVFLLFSFASIIVLMNLLIAIISDSYENVQL